MASQEENQSARIEGDHNRISQTQQHQPLTLAITLEAPERAAIVSIQHVRIEVTIPGYAS